MPEISHDGGMDRDIFEAFVEQLDRYVRDRLIPAETEVLETDRVPAEILREMRELGLFGITIPVAYGGSWIMGERAAFGMNIFEPFRGGESGFMMCQVLRTYRQTFGVRYFEVHAHQSVRL